MFAGMQGWHLLIVLAVILLLFGAAKLPALAKSMGQSARLFKGEMKAMKEEETPANSEGSAEQNSVAAGNAAHSTQKTPGATSGDTH